MRSLFFSGILACATALDYAPVLQRSTTGFDAISGTYKPVTQALCDTAAVDNIVKDMTHVTKTWDADAGVCIFCLSHSGTNYCNPAFKLDTTYEQSGTALHTFLYTDRNVYDTPTFHLKSNYDNYGRVIGGGYIAAFRTSNYEQDLEVVLQSQNVEFKCYLNSWQGTNNCDMQTYSTVPTAATCATYDGCADDSLKLGSVSCSGDETTCNENTCCDDPATCNEFTTCADDSFYKINKGNTVQCVGDKNTCSVDRCCEGIHCDLTEWGTGLPFSSQTGVTFNGGDISNIKVNFGVQTQSCVDRKNWVKATLHKLGTPVCEEKVKNANNGCADLDEQACDDNQACRYRIPCEVELDGANKAPFKVEYDVKTRDPQSTTQDTEFEISITTAKLAQATDVYSKPSQGETKAKLEFCVRPAVQVGSTTILFRELVLRAHIGMDGSFSDLQIASDSFQQDAVQDVDQTISLSATAFACKLKTGSNNVYEQLSVVPTLTPNQVFTLCVAPSSTAVQCDDINKLTFEQDRSNQGGEVGFSEDRIKDTIPQNLLLTSDPAIETVEVVDNSVSPPVVTQYSGCVVSSRLEAVYFAAVNPNPIKMSGSALLGFIPSSSGGRKLREESVRSSMALVVPGKRNLQEEEQTASFDVQFQLSKNQDNTESNNRVQIDAAANVAWYHLTSALAAVAALMMI